MKTILCPLERSRRLTPASLLAHVYETDMQAIFLHLAFLRTARMRRPVDEHSRHRYIFLENLLLSSVFHSAASSLAGAPFYF